MIAKAVAWSLQLITHGNWLLQMNEFLASLERFSEKTAFLTSTQQIYTITRKLLLVQLYLK